jgi:hypothetical protein
MSSQAFIQAREKGKEGQHYVAEMFRNWGLTVYEIEDGHFPDWDLQVFSKDNDKPRTVEVKHDFAASKTGNICLELEALFHSKADLLAIVTDNPRTVYMVPLQQALAFADSYPNKKKVGEFQLEAALIPKQTFISSLNPQILTTQ